MPSDQIPRSPMKMNPDDFKELLDLNNDYPWLQSESDGLIELWNFCEQKEQRTMISALLKRFEVVDSKRLKEYGEEVATIIQNNWGATPDNARVVAVSDKPYADGSQAFLQSLKNKFSPHDGWREDCFINDIREAVNVAQDGWTIVLLDDFIGTGKTITRKVNWILDEFAKVGKTRVSIKVVAVAAMNDASRALNNLNVEYHCPLWLRKGIAEFSDEHEAAEFIGSMQDLEEKLGKMFQKLQLKHFNFGYGKCETLFFIESYNAPNNVFPVFWWPVLKDSTRRNPLLKRLR